VLSKVGIPPPAPLLALLVSVSDWPGKESLLAQINQAGMAQQGAPPQ